MMMLSRLKVREGPDGRPEAGLRKRFQRDRTGRRSSMAGLGRPLTVGVLGMLGMAGLYLGFVTLVGSWQHALDLLREDAPYVLPIILGFGIQLGLLTYLRLALPSGHVAGRAGAVTGASGGTSTAGMIACCAHHVSDVLPLVGLSGATAFLANYKIPFLVLGLLSNAAGVFMLLAAIRRVTHTSKLNGDGD
jgi:hypothetical protein